VNLNEGQRAAVDRLTEWIKGDEPEISLTGVAGSGKTTILNMLKQRLEENFDGILWTAMTGKAALRMRDLADVPATTFHSAFFEAPDDESGQDVRFERVKKTEAELLVIDEASMMPPTLHKLLRDHWIEQGVRVLYVGDFFQLPPVMSKEETLNHGEDYSIFHHVKGPILTQVMRSGDDVLWAATAVRESGMLPRESKGSYIYSLVEDAAAEAVNCYVAQQREHALVTWRNDMRVAASTGVRKALGFTSEMPGPGEPILVCKNGQNHLNGEIIDAGEFSPGPKLGPIETLRMKLDEPIVYYDRRGELQQRMSLITLTNMDGKTPYIEDREDWKAYATAKRKTRTPEPLPMTWGYALTVHKAQGSEYDEVTLFLTKQDVFSKPFKRPSLLPNGQQTTFGTRLIYTAVTRARKRVRVVLGNR
jgi:exodeoxyribonuclease-5